MQDRKRIRHRIQVAARKLIRPKILGLLLLIALIVPLLSILIDKSYWEFRDDASDRGAVASAQDPLAGAYQKTVYLKQNWGASDSLWFYETTQGSDLVPYDFYLALETAGSELAFGSSANVLRWNFLPQHKTTRNPDALPVGFAEDSYAGKRYLGLTCAACHTTQVNYKGTGIRIDGGPSLANMQLFLDDLGAALAAAAPAPGQNDCGNDKCRRFVQAVTARGHYKPADAIRDLQVFSNRIAVYNQINHATVAYGYGRLDAFGRIFNRVLQHIVQRRQLDDLLPQLFNAAELPVVRAALKPVLYDVHSDAQALDIDQHVIEYALPLLNPTQQAQLIRGLFNEPNAPVSYPFLWDVSQHDFVQWNGLVANAGLGALGRNVGEVIGVFATLDWQVKKGFSLSAILGGQGFRKEHISYHSSARIDDLRRIEAQVSKLQSPVWPEDILGAIDSGQRTHGEALFNQYCEHCHGNIQRDSPDRRVVASMNFLDTLGTDRTMANNSFKATGYSGLLRNQYVATFGAGDVLIDNRSRVVAELSKVAAGVIADPHPSWNIFKRFYDWVHELYLSYTHNEIHPSLKSGDYQPDTSVNPYASLAAYKGRSLNGIWATAPYLHNGSVPSLAALLLPKRPPGAGPGDYRPDVFYVGSREFDPVAVGFKSDQGDPSQKFDALLPGNDNAGHEYGSVNDPLVKGGKMPALSSDDRRDLLMYLKSL
jgi:cytochrome c5